MALDDERYDAYWEDLGREMRRRRPAVRYGEYLASAAWAERREAAKARAAGRCQLCGDTDAPLQVHHNSYARLGAELETDLCVLCAPCHSALHDRRVLAEQRRAVA